MKGEKPANLNVRIFLSSRVSCYIVVIHGHRSNQVHEVFFAIPVKFSVLQKHNSVCPGLWNLRFLIIILIETLEKSRARLCLKTSTYFWLFFLARAGKDVVLRCQLSIEVMLKPDHKQELVEQETRL